MSTAYITPCNDCPITAVRVCDKPGCNYHCAVLPCGFIPRASASPVREFRIIDGVTRVCFIYHMLSVPHGDPAINPFKATITIPRQQICDVSIAALTDPTSSDDSD